MDQVLAIIAFMELLACCVATFVLVNSRLFERIYGNSGTSRRAGRLALIQVVIIACPLLAFWVLCRWLNQDEAHAFCAVLLSAYITVTIALIFKSGNPKTQYRRGLLVGFLVLHLTGMLVTAKFVAHPDFRGTHESDMQLKVFPLVLILYFLAVIQCVGF
jgi:glucose-6-phosphate-specific signal transduction histidine kinase